MSSGSESDGEYVPGEPEQVSEEESADEETDQQYEKELEHKTQKRKAKEETKGKNKRFRNRVLDEEKVEKNLPEPPLDAEKEKKREDDLWAKFLEGTDTKPKPKETSLQIDKSIPVHSKDTAKNAKQTKEDNKERERRIFEFAGETIVVEKNVIKEKIKAAESPVPGKIFKIFCET